MKEFFILTIFPEIIETYTSYGIIKQAIKKGLAKVHPLDLRKYAERGEVDDKAFGGVPGMVLKPEPVFKAYDQLCKDGSKPFVIVTQPWGKVFDQKLAEELEEKDRILIICGRYEGIDERVREITDLEVSVGDFVLSGGELPALMITEAVIRLIPGAVSEPESLRRDSFSGRWLGYPVYTKPREFRGMKVPEVLLSGNHRLIELWCLFQSIKRTIDHRPDLIPGNLTETEKEIVEAIKKGMTFEEWMERTGVKTLS